MTDSAAQPPDQPTPASVPQIAQASVAAMPAAAREADLPLPPPPRGRRRGGRRGWLWLLAMLAVVVAFFLFRNNLPSRFGLREDGGAPQLVYLLLLLAFIGAGLLGRRMQAREVIRGIVTWTLIIIVLIGIYASRDQLAGVAGRILGAIAPGVPISGTLSGEDNPQSVAVVRGAEGHFAVRARIDERPAELLVDTGASFVTLTQDVARAIGIDPDALVYDVRINTANGPMRAAAVTIRRIAVGPIVRSNIKGLVAPAGALDLSLLGMTFLNTLQGYAISGDRLVMTP